MAIVLCASLMTSPIIGEPDQTDFTEQQQSVIIKGFSNSYDAIKTDIISILTLIKNNPVKSFLAIATLMYITMGLSNVIWLAQERTCEDLHYEIQQVLQALNNQKWNSDIEKALLKLQACYKDSPFSLN